MKNIEFYKDTINAIGFANIALVDGKIINGCDWACAKCDWNKYKGSNARDCVDTFYEWMMAEKE